MVVSWLHVSTVRAVIFRPYIKGKNVSAVHRSFHVEIVSQLPYELPHISLFSLAMSLNEVDTARTGMVNSGYYLCPP